MWPFNNSYPQRSLRNLGNEYDFVIAGGGTAGCVLARRLSESGKYTVLLVEKGDAADRWLHHTPLTSLHHWSDGKHSAVFDSVSDSKLGRSFSLVSGLGLGGSTRINGGQYTCGVPAEYNAWSQQGRMGWDYHQMKQYFLKSESWIGPVPEDWHGSNGPLKVRSFEDYQYRGSGKAAEAAEKLGFAAILDMHSPLEPSIGWNKMQFTIDALGTRQSSFRAYLPQDVAESRRDHLHICTGAVAGKLEFSRQINGSMRAESIEIHAADGRGSTRIVKARREIILACGALWTPQVLMLSGVGAEEHLQKMGIEVVHHLSGVGAHLEDHLLIPTSYYCPLPDSLWAMIRRPTTLISQLYQYLRHGTGWLLCRMVEMEIFGKSSVVDSDGKLNALAEQQKDPSDPKNKPDFAVMTCGIADPRGSGIDRSRGFFGLNCALLKAESQGQIFLRSRNPLDHPVCEMRYLSSPQDWSAIRAALRVSVQLARQMHVDGYPLESVSVPAALDDATLDEFIKEKVDTMYHYSSTCRMAPLTDPMHGVVDDELHVHGISNLRISDASIFPSVPTTHPQALVYAVAEKCADMVLASYE